MKINKVSCTQFAGITNKELSFGDGINVVFGKNESGKSTVVNLISRLLFQNARIDGRSDKSFRELYFPAARKGSSFVGDYADGKLEFETENGCYTLSKEWGKVPSCKLATPEGITNDQEKVSNILKDAIIYGEGVYADMLLSPQRAADTALATILDASKKTDAKQEIINAVSEAFAEGDGISADALEAAIEKNIDELAGKHWDIERSQPVRKPGGGEWVNGLGKVLTAYYELEKRKKTISELKALEERSDSAAERFKILDARYTVAKNKLETFNDYYSALAVLTGKRRETARLEKDLSKLEDVLTRWPDDEKKLKEALELKKEKELSELSERYAAAKKLKDELDEANSEMSASRPEAAEISKVRSAKTELMLNENKLRGMNITAAIKLFNGSSVEVRSLRTGELLDVSKGDLHITEAVSVTIPGVMEMTLAPANINADEIGKAIAESSDTIKCIYSKYGVDSVEKLEKLRLDSEASRIKADALKAKLALQLAGCSYEELEERARDAVSCRTPYEINKAIFALCGGFDEVRFITEKETVIKGYVSEYGSMEELRAKAMSASEELIKARSSVTLADNIPEEYADIADPEAHLALLKNRCETALKEREKALTEKSTAAFSLDNSMEREGYDAEERLEKAEREFEEQKSMLSHWLHIREVFRSVREGLKNDPTGDIAARLAEYLGIISGGRLISDFREGTLDISVYSENRLMDHDKLSEGTKETVSLAYRLAVLDHLFPDGGGIMVLDDPLTDMDKTRAERSCKIIKECAGRHQIIFLTCREDYCDLLGGNRINI